MKRFVGLSITCILLCLFASCSVYKNVTFVENNIEEYILYQSNEYYETSIFTATEYYGIENENDFELGWYYSFPFSTKFYSDNLENPVFIYTIGGDTNMYLRQDYEYFTDTFVIDGTDAEIVWQDIFCGEKNSLDFFNQITVNLYSKQYPRIKTSIDLAFVDQQWYVRYSNSQKIFIPSEEFLKILSDNEII